MQRLFKELNLELKEPIRVFSNSQSAIYMSKDPVFHDRTKHVDIDRYFIKEKLETRQLELHYFLITSQVADMFIKTLSRKQFEFLRSKLGLLNIYNPN